MLCTSMDSVFDLEDVVLGALAPDQVRVKIKATGVCHTGW